MEPACQPTWRRKGDVWNIQHHCDDLKSLGGAESFLRRWFEKCSLYWYLRFIIVFKISRRNIRRPNYIYEDQHHPVAWFIAFVLCSLKSKLLIASKLQISERKLNLWSSRPWNWAPKKSGGKVSCNSCPGSKWRLEVSFCGHIAPGKGGFWCMLGSSVVRCT